jgi:hypothetical protein
MLLCMCCDDQERMEAMGEVAGGTMDAARMGPGGRPEAARPGPRGPAPGPARPHGEGIGDVRRIYDGQVIFAEELMSLRLD